MKLAFRESKLRTVLVLCTIGFVIVNLILTIRLAADINKLAGPVSKRSPLPCGAIPTRFVMEEPECADKLLRSMNVTNVRVLPVVRGSSAELPHLINASKSS
jgi:hypothetical protein